MHMLWTAVMESLKAGQPVQTVTSVRGENVGQWALYAKDGGLLAGEDLGANGADGLAVSGNVSLFRQWLWPRPGLVIFGGGHVAVPTARLGALLGFEVVVVDDRHEFANAQRFPDAKALALPYEQAFARLAINPRHYLVIVTRGHVHDNICLEKALETDAAYIGVIGSRKKAEETRVWLAARGFSAAAIDRVFSPIGLDIGARTPEEIAVSILAEIIREKSSRPASSGIEEIAQALAAKPVENWALITIVAAQGSTPQGAGARMLLKANGETVGTVGGGLIENMALTAAREVMATGIPRLVEFSLDSSLAAETGMICGGKLQAFIEVK